MITYDGDLDNLDDLDGDDTTSSISFNGTLTPTSSNSRFASSQISIEYFAANGPWEIRVYTQNANNAQGLVNEDGDSFVELKIDVEDRDGNFGIVTNDDHWSGGDDVLEFFRILDDNAMTESNTPVPFFAVIASTANENPDQDSDLRAVFGIDIAGASADTHSADVIFDLAIL